MIDMRRTRRVVNGPDFSCVGDFHRRFGLPHIGTVTTPTLDVGRDVVQFRLKFLEEELAELKEAYERDDLPGVADALVDLVYVALGTAHIHGIPWGPAFGEVHAANMQKERAASDGSNSKRLHSFDVVKPDGWEPPDVAEVLRDSGWGG